MFKTKDLEEGKDLLLRLDQWLEHKLIKWLEDNNDWNQFLNLNILISEYIKIYIYKLYK